MSTPKKYKQLDKLADSVAVVLGTEDFTEALKKVGIVAANLDYWTSVCVYSDGERHVDICANVAGEDFTAFVQCAMQALKEADLAKYINNKTKGELNIRILGPDDPDGKSGKGKPAAKKAQQLDTTGIRMITAEAFQEAAWKVDGIVCIPLCDPKYLVRDYPKTRALKANSTLRVYADTRAAAALGPGIGFVIVDGYGNILDGYNRGGVNLIGDVRDSYRRQQA